MAVLSLSSWHILISTSKRKTKPSKKTNKKTYLARKVLNDFISRSSSNCRISWQRSTFGRNCKQVFLFLSAHRWTVPRWVSVWSVTGSTHVGHLHRASERVNWENWKNPFSRCTWENMLLTMSQLKNRRTSHEVPLVVILLNCIFLPPAVVWHLVLRRPRREGFWGTFLA